LEGLSQSGLVMAGYRHFANWYEEIESLDSYWSRRPRRLHATVERKGRKLAASRFRILSSPAELEEGALLYDEIYAASGKCAEPHPGFMTELMRRLAPLDQLRLGLLMAGDVPIAAQLWLVQRREATIFKLAHRLEYSSYSPGTILTHRMFSSLIPALGIERVDFGRGDDGYKRDWLRSRAFRKGVIACNPGSLSGLRTIATAIFPTWAGAALRQVRGTA
jgi:hypothetical protein